MIINTNGSDVTFTPIIDGTQISSPTVFNTSSKLTVFHYFNYDVFGIDFRGSLSGNNYFEFYEMLKPEDVETLPVGKLFDQVGPLELKKLGKILAFRVRVVTMGSVLPYNIFMEDSSILTGALTTVPNKEGVYETQVPKSTNGTILRVELGPTVLPFYRFYVDFKVVLSGGQTDAQWIKVK